MFVLIVRNQEGTVTDVRLTKTLDSAKLLAANLFQDLPGYEDLKLEWTKSEDFSPGPKWESELEDQLELDIHEVYEEEGKS